MGRSSARLIRSGAAGGAVHAQLCAAGQDLRPILAGHRGHRALVCRHILRERHLVCIVTLLWPLHAVPQGLVAAWSVRSHSADPQASSARRASAGLAVANSSERNTGDGPFVPARRELRYLAKQPTRHRAFQPSLASARLLPAGLDPDSSGSTAEATGAERRRCVSEVVVSVPSLTNPYISFSYFRASLIILGEQKGRHNSLDQGEDRT